LYHNLPCFLFVVSASERATEKKKIKNQEHDLKALASNMKNINTAFLKLVMYQRAIKSQLEKAIETNRIKTVGEWNLKFRNQFKNYEKQFSDMKAYGRGLEQKLKVLKFLLSMKVNEVIFSNK